MTRHPPMMTDVLVVTMMIITVEKKGQAIRHDRVIQSSRKEDVMQDTTIFSGRLARK